MIHRPDDLVKIKMRRWEMFATGQRIRTTNQV